MAIDIALQPKQSELLESVRNSPYAMIGYGGSNGGGKSDGIRSVNLIMCIDSKKIAPIRTLIFRRKSNDLLENHIIPFFLLPISEALALVNCLPNLFPLGAPIFIFPYKIKCDL